MAKIFVLLSFLFLLGGQTAWAEASYIQINTENMTATASGLFQARYAWQNLEGGSTTQGFDISLARLGLGGQLLRPDVTYFAQLQATTAGDSNTVTWLDLWMTYRASEYLSVQAGRLLIPYSRQFYTHPGYLLQSDLSAADYAFNLPRSTGAQVYGKVGRLSYNLAALNSVRALDGSGQRNSQNPVAGVLRLEYDVLAPYGYAESGASVSEEPALSFGLAGAVNPAVETSVMQNVAAGDKTHNMTADFGYRLGRFTAQGAYYQRWNHSQDIGFYGQVGYQIVPTQWELTARHSVVNFGEQRTTQNWDVTRESTLGLNRYFNGHKLKLQSEYSLIQQESFSSQKQNNHRVLIQAQFMF